jgi:hypothetical protein
VGADLGFSKLADGATEQHLILGRTEVHEPSNFTIRAEERTKRVTGCALQADARLEDVARGFSVYKRGFSVYKK